MIKKKVLVHGSLKSLREFFSSPFSVEFAPLAIVTDEPINVALALNPQGGGGNLKSLLSKNFRVSQCNSLTELF